MKIFFVSVLVLLCSHTFSQGLFEGPDCNTRTSKITLKADLRESTVLSLMLALDQDTVKNIIDFCGRSHTAPEEQMICVKGLSAESSSEPEEISQKVLTYIAENFISLDEFLLTYDKEQKECLEYYSYGGLGYCIPYTGRECWDEKATVAIIPHFFSVGGYYYHDREYLTPPDEEGTVHCIKEWYRGTTLDRYQPVIIRVFKK